MAPSFPSRRQPPTCLHYRWNAPAFLDRTDRNAIGAVPQLAGRFRHLSPRSTDTHQRPSTVITLSLSAVSPTSDSTSCTLIFSTYSKSLPLLHCYLMQASFGHAGAGSERLRVPDSDGHRFSPLRPIWSSSQRVKRITARETSSGSRFQSRRKGES